MKIHTLIYDTRTKQQPEASNIKKELVNTFGETSSIMNNTWRLIFEHIYTYIFSVYPLAIAMALVC